MKQAFLILTFITVLSACGEKPQVLQANMHDSAAYSGTGKAFALPNWKQGDQASWESQLKARQQYGQNDYSHMN